jgi:hypothetical protein
MSNLDIPADSDALKRLLQKLEEERNDLPDDVVENLDEVHEELKKENKDYESLKRKLYLIVVKIFTKESVKEIFEFLFG